MQQEWQLYQVRLWSRVGWVATGRASVLSNAEEQGGLGCSKNGNNLRSSRGPVWVGLQQEGHQYWVMLRNRMGWVGKNGNYIRSAVEQGGLGCNMKAINPGSC